MDIVDSILELMFWVRFTTANIIIFENLKYQKIDILNKLIKNKNIIFYYYMPKEYTKKCLSDCLIICGFDVIKEVDYFNNLFKPEFFSWDQNFILDQMLNNITLEHLYFKHHKYLSSNSLFLNNLESKLGLKYSIKYHCRI